MAQRFSDGGSTPPASIVYPDFIVVISYHEAVGNRMCRRYDYGRRGIFEPAFLEWLERDFRLSDYELSIQDGQFSLSFRGLWTATTMWEIYALSAISELKTRASLKRLSEFELDILYARAKTKLWGKMDRLRGIPELKVSDFGTRRRHSFLWQEYVVKAMSDVLGNSFTRTSNTYLAYKHDLEAIGTNAHELPTALAAMAKDDEELLTAQYRLLELWQQTYQGELLILLSDTFGTSQFLRNAPDWVADWTGQRAQTAKILSLRATNTLRGLNRETAIHGKNYSLLPTPSMWTRFGGCMPIFPGPCATALLLPILDKRATFSMRQNGFPSGASVSVRVGARC